MSGGVRLWRGASRLPADIALSVIPSLPRNILERLAAQIVEDAANAIYDGEDAGSIILPGANGAEPTAWRAS